MPAFSVIQKAFVVNSKWEVLIEKLPATGNGPILYDLPGGKLDFETGLRDSLTSQIKMHTGLTLGTVSIPLNVTTYLNWIDRSNQIVRVIYLCTADGKVTPLDPSKEFFWIDPATYKQYAFPDEGYALAFENFHTHSELPSSEFLGSGILTDTTQYLRTKKSTPII